MREERTSPKLSPREEQLLQYAAEGLTDTAIALKLGISEATVGTYWGRVRIKLGPYSRTELVAHRMRMEGEEALGKLRAENEELVKQLKQERAGNTSYRELLEYAPDAMMVVTPEGVIEFLNGAALELFGYAEGDLVGQHLLQLIPERFRIQHLEHHRDYMEHPDRRMMGGHLDTPALHKTGREFAIRAALSTIQGPGASYVICAIRPVEGN